MLGSRTQSTKAWVIARAEHIVTIPGTKRRKYLEENIDAAQVELTEEELKRVDEIAPRGAAAGECYPAALMSSINI